MIFKTFNSDIDKISAKWGIFGRSFNEIGTAIVGRITDIKNGFQATYDLIGAFGDTKSVWERLYPSKESIQSQLIDVDTLIPKIDVKNFDFDRWINKLDDVDKKVKANKWSWQDFSNTLDENQQWIAKWGQETQGQIRTQEELVKANKNARQAAIAHNNALKQQTLGAKATTVALKALSIAGSMIVMWAISKVIEIATNCLNAFIHSAENTTAALEESAETFKDVSSEIEDYNSELETSQERIEELQRLVKNGTISVAEKDELELLKKENEELQRKILLTKEQQALEAKQLLKSLNTVNGNNYSVKMGGTTWGNGLFKKSSAVDALQTYINQYSYWSNTAIMSEDQITESQQSMLEVADAVYQSIEAYQSLIDFGYADELDADYQRLLQVQDAYIKLLYDINKSESTFSALSATDKREILSQQLKLQRGFSDKKIDAIISSIEDEDLYKFYNKSLDFIEPTSSSYSNIKEYGKAYAEAWLAGIESAIEHSSSTSFTLSESQSEALDTYEKVLDNIKKVYQEYKDLDKIDIIKLFEDTSFDFTDFLSGNSDLETTLSKLSTDAYNTVRKTFSSLSDDDPIIIELLNKKQGLRGDAFGWEEALHDINTLQPFLEKVKDDVVFTMEELDAYISEYELSDALLNVEGGYKVDKETVEELLNKAKEEYNAALSLFRVYLRDQDFTETSIDAFFGSLNVYYDIVDLSSTSDSDIVDGYEIAVDRIEQCISDLDKKIDDSDITLEKRNELLQEQIDLYEDLIAVHTNAAQDYKDKFDKVEFSSSELEKKYKTLIQKGVRSGDGSITFSSEIDEEAFQQAEEYWNNYLDSNSAILDAQAEMKDIFNELNNPDTTLLDWVEIKLDTISRKLEAFNKTSSNTYLGFDVRKTALQDQIEATLNAIPELQQAVQTYQEYADSINLDDSLKSLAKNGDLSITTAEAMGLTENEVEKINDYSEALDKLYNAQSQLDDLISSVPELGEELFTLSQTEADLKIEEINNAISSLEQTLESANYLNSTNKFDLLDNLSNQNKELSEACYSAVTSLQELYDELIKLDGFEASGEIGKGLLSLITEYKNSGAEAELKSMEYDTQRFDELVSQYEKLLVENENRKNLLETKMAQAEAKGYINTASYYNHLVENQLEQQTINAEKLESLQEELSRIELEYSDFENSDIWHDKKQEIEEVTQALEDGTLQLIEYNNAIRQIKWDVFDFLQDQIETVSDEASFLIDLFSNLKQFDEKGQLTDIGWATMGNYSVIYETSLSQAKKYADELATIEEELVENPNDTTLIERKNELIGLYQEETLAAESAKQSMIDLVEEGINLELESLSELIDSYKEALQAQKDLYDWQKKSANQSKTIAQLQKQLAAYENDTSEEAKAKIQQIRVQLEEAQSDMEDIQYDHYISEQEELLSALYQEYETVLNERLDNVDVLFQELINDVNKNSSTISNTVKTETDKWGYELQTGLLKIWDINSDIETSIGDSTDTIGSIINGTFNEIDNSINDVGDSISDKLDDVFSSLENTIKDTTESEDSDALLSIKENVETYCNLVAGEGGYWKNLIQMLAFIATDLTNIRATIETWDFSSFYSSNLPTSNNTVGSNNNDTNSSNDNNSNYSNSANSSISNSATSTKNEGTTPKNYEVGDTVTGVTGTWYADSYGGGESGLVTTLGATSWKIEKILDRTDVDYPYHLIGYNDGKFAGSGWVSLNQLPKYHTGLENSPKDHLAWTQDGGQEIIVTKDGAVLTYIGTGDSVLNAKGTKNIFDLANQPDKFIKSYMPTMNTSLLDFPASSFSNQSVANNIENHFEFNVSGVNDVNSLIKEVKYDLQHDKKFENMIGDMMNSKISNGSSTAKYRYQW